MWVVLEQLLERAHHELHEQPMAFETVRDKPECRAHVRVAQRQHQLRLSLEVLLACLALVHKLERGERTKVTDGKHRAESASPNLMEHFDATPVDHWRKRRPTKSDTFRRGCGRN